MSWARRYDMQRILFSRHLCAQARPPIRSENALAKGSLGDWKGQAVQSSDGNSAALYMLHRPHRVSGPLRTSRSPPFRPIRCKLSYACQQLRTNLPLRFIVELGLDSAFWFRYNRYSSFSGPTLGEQGRVGEPTLGKERCSSIHNYHRRLQDDSPIERPMSSTKIRDRQTCQLHIHMRVVYIVRQSTVLRPQLNCSITLKYVGMPTFL